MSFCNQCGNQIADNSKFCNICGAPVGNQAGNANIVSSSPIILQQKTRMESLNELDRIIAYFSKIQNSYNELIECFEKKVALQNRKTKINVPVKRGTKFKIPGIIITAESAIAIFTFILAFLNLYLTSKDGEIITVEFNIYLIALLVCLVLLILGIVLMVIGSKKNREYRNAVNNARGSLTIENEKRIKELVNEIGEHYFGFGYCPLGIEYTFPLTLEKIRQCLFSGRADTIKEAVNVLAMDERDAKWESMLNQAIQAAETAAYYAQSAANAPHYHYHY